MKLLTAEIIAKLKKSPRYSHEDKPANEVPIIVKFFTPWSNWTWFVTEGEQREDGDWEFFGMVHGFEHELGYFVLSELAEIKGPFGLRIERDMHFHDKTLADVA